MLVILCKSSTSNWFMKYKFPQAFENIEIKSVHLMPIQIPTKQHWGCNKRQSVHLMPMNMINDFEGT